jgi:hypothetical protein
VPKRYRNKVATLGDYLKSFPNLLRVSPTGRAIVNGVELQHTNIMDIVRSLYIWPKTQTHPRGTLEVVQALHSIGVPGFVLSNSTVRAMYHDLVEAAEETHTEAEETEETETETEGQEAEGYGKQAEEHEGETFETPMHATGPPVQPLVLKAEGHVPSKASPTMIPRLLQRSSSIPSSTKKDESPKPSTAGVAPKTSGVPTTSGQSKFGSSQTSTKTEHTKPGTAHVVPKRGQVGKGRGGSDECASECASDDDDDSCLPGKRSRILRLPQPGKFVLLRERPHAGGGVEQVYADPYNPGATIRVLRLKPAQ